MARIIRTDAAVSDIASIAEYIAADNLPAADRWIEQIDSTVRLLARYPTIGQRVEHLGAGLRRYCLRNYLIFYRPIDRGIELRRVLHGARQIEDLFRDE